MESVVLIYTHDEWKTKSTYLLIGVVQQLYLDLTINDLIVTSDYTRDEISFEIVNIGDYDPSGLL